MDECASSGFGDESPILFKHPKSFNEVHYTDRSLNLDELYAELLLHLKKSKIIPREELKSYLEQVSTMKHEDPKNRWLVKKIKGVLKFILKKRAEFQTAIVKGEIVVYEKGNSGQSLQSAAGAEASSQVNIPSDMLTNNNFVSMNVVQDSSEHVAPVVADIKYNCSEDLFNSNTADILYNYGQENYQLLKTLTQNSASNDIFLSLSNENDGTLFKVPLEVKMETVYEVHETLEEDYKSIISQTPSVARTVTAPECNPVKFESNDTIADITMENLENKNPGRSSASDENVVTNIFEGVTNVDLKRDYNHQAEDADHWISEAISKLMKLNTRKTRKAKIEVNDECDPSISLNKTYSSVGSELQPCYTEENYKIIKETCLKFKNNLQKKEQNIS